MFAAIGCVLELSLGWCLVGVVCRHRQAAAAAAGRVQRSRPCCLGGCFAVVAAAPPRGAEDGALVVLGAAVGEPSVLGLEHGPRPF